MIRYSQALSLLLLFSPLVSMEYKQIAGPINDKGSTGQPIKRSSQWEPVEGPSLTTPQIEAPVDLTQTMYAIEKHEKLIKENGPKIAALRAEEKRLKSTTPAVDGLNVKMQEVIAGTIQNVIKPQVEARRLIIHKLAIKEAALTGSQIRISSLETALAQEREVRNKYLTSASKLQKALGLEETYKIPTDITPTVQASNEKPTAPRGWFSFIW